MFPLLAALETLQRSGRFGLIESKAGSAVWELMLGATIHITLSPRQMFALLGIPQIRPQLVMSLIMHARTPEDNH